MTPGEEGGQGLTEAGKGLHSILRPWESRKAFQLGASLGLGKRPGKRLQAEDRLVGSQASTQGRQYLPHDLGQRVQEGCQKYQGSLEPQVTQ